MHVITKRVGHGKALFCTDDSTVWESLGGNASPEQLALLLHCPRLDWAESRVGQMYKALS